MNDLSNYYENDPVQNADSIPSERFPKNHVHFPAVTKPLEWIDNVYRSRGARAFQLKDAMLKEFDSAAPLDKYLGTKEELKETRKIVEVFCEGIDENPFLSPVGRFIIKKYVMERLKNRKKVLAYYHKNKGFIEANGKIKAPIIITGLPRSGTTLLQRIMAQDPNTRSPYTFEMDVPIPPMEAKTNPLEDPRIKKSATYKAAKADNDFLRKFTESHLLSATEMEESLVYMLNHNGLSQLNAPTAGRKYMDMNFYGAQDKRTIFRYERLFFTMLDAYRPARSHWTLKAPNYAPCFSMIFDEYPDARVVITHRNPLVTLPSVCRLFESWCIAFDRDGAFDKHRFGRLIVPGIRNCLMAPLQFRKDQPEKETQIFDCMYKELFSDPISMVKAIYEKFDLEYTAEFEKRMKNYLMQNKQGKYGRHKYSIEEYGFNRQDLYQQFKDYMERYGFSKTEKIERPDSFDFSLSDKPARAESYATDVA